MQRKSSVEDNLAVCVTLADFIRTSLGPNARSKLVVKSSGDIVVSRDGAQVLNELKPQHPFAKLLVQLSAAQDAAVGDGTTSVVVLAGAMCSAAIKLLRAGAHPLVIVEGYRAALSCALDAIRACTTKVDVSTDEALQTIVAQTVSETANASALARIAVTAVRLLAEAKVPDLPVRRVKVDRLVGGSLNDSRLIRGVLIRRTFMNESMPHRIENARVLVLSCALETPRLKTKHSITVRSVTEQAELLKLQRDSYESMTQQIVASGANVVLCQWAIEVEIAQLLAAHGIAAIAWLAGDELERAALAVNASICSNLGLFQANMLGIAGVVAEEILGTQEERVVVIDGCVNARALTVLIRGGSNLICDDGTKTLNDCLLVARQLILSPFVVPAGGAMEARASYSVETHFAASINVSAEAARQWAQAVLVIPQALVENAGESAALQTRELVAQHTRGRANIGINAYGQCVDMVTAGVQESLIVRETALRLATECACQIIRVDELVLHPLDDDLTG
eukprot:TRINITY_DN3118_c0_g1_i2.p2 TRINITY_DN3118_c0_g1~~TRINITY_DN3118_c0_g1_i2.p2  ORF type:complete len:511 (+),score=157.75 TRINITY_DN3118_c0_g1_i2:221-1753(+)